MPSAHLIRGVYAITDPGSGPRLARDVERALAGGAAVVQYRDKSSGPQRRRGEAEDLRRLCKDYGALFIVNDDAELAAAVDADGVHLGEDDTALGAARLRLGANAIIGASCYNSLERADRALAAGADYLAFGSFYDSPTKPAARRASLDLLGRARRRYRVPLVAIGGITVDNAAALAKAGADAIAVISAVFNADDPAEGVRALRRALGIVPD